MELLVLKSSILLHRIMNVTYVFSRCVQQAQTTTFGNLQHLVCYGWNYTALPAKCFLFSASYKYLVVVCRAWHSEQKLIYSTLESTSVHWLCLDTGAHTQSAALLMINGAFGRHVYATKGTLLELECEIHGQELEQHLLGWFAAESEAAGRKRRF